MIPPKKDLRSGQPQWGRDQSRKETNRTRRKPGSEEKCWFLEWHLCHTAQYGHIGFLKVTNAKRFKVPKWT